MSIEPGQVYRHYKGHTYTIIALAKHSETLADLVIYQNREEPQKIWARPIKMFSEEVSIEGKTVFRFTLLTD